MKKGTNDSLYLCLIKRQPKKPTEYMIKALTSMNLPVPITTTRAYWGDAGYCKLPKKLSPKKEMPVGTKQRDFQGPDGAFHNFVKKGEFAPIGPESAAAQVEEYHPVGGAGREDGNQGQCGKDHRGAGLARHLGLK